MNVGLQKALKIRSMSLQTLVFAFHDCFAILSPCISYMNFKTLRDFVESVDECGEYCHLNKSSTINIGYCFIYLNLLKFLSWYFIVFTVQVLTYFLIFIPKYFIIFYLQHIFNYADRTYKNSTSKHLLENG